MTLVDTSVWIDFLAARNTVQAGAFESLIDQREDLCLCGVILTEVLQGIRDGKQYKQTESVLSSLIYLPMDQKHIPSRSQYLSHPSVTWDHHKEFSRLRDRSRMHRT
jgi:predicted nucleic acid-binding protein